MSRTSWVAAIALIVFFAFLASFLVLGEPARDSREVLDRASRTAAEPLVTATAAPTETPGATPTATEVTTTPMATSVLSLEAPPVVGVTPVAEFEVTVISTQVPANVRRAASSEAEIAGVIPLGVKAKVVGQVVGEEAFAGSGIRIWYLVSAIPPDLPEDGFVYSAVVVR